MILTELRIKKYDNWRDEPNAPSYTGSVSLQGENHKIEMRVNEELIKKIIELCADSVVDCAKETAEIMRGEIINQVKQLPTARLTCPQGRERKDDER